MAIEIIPISGRCPYFDYNVFEQSVYKTLKDLDTMSGAATDLFNLSAVLRCFC